MRSYVTWLADQRSRCVRTRTYSEIRVLSEDEQSDRETGEGLALYCSRIRYGPNEFGYGLKVASEMPVVNGTGVSNQSLEET